MYFDWQMCQEQRYKNEKESEVKEFQKSRDSKGPLPSLTPPYLGSQEVKVVWSAKECVKSSLLESASVPTCTLNTYAI